jgi:hypothetical protein
MNVSTHSSADEQRALQSVGDMYAQAAQTATGYLQAFLAAPARSLDDWQAYQRTWIDWLGRTTELTARATRDLAGCHDLQQLAEMQRQYAQESRRHFLEASNQMLDISTRIAESAGSRIEEEASAVGERGAEETRRRRSASTATANAE